MNFDIMNNVLTEPDRHDHKIFFNLVGPKLISEMDRSLRERRGSSAVSIYNACLIYKLTFRLLMFRFSESK